MSVIDEPMRLRIEITNRREPCAMLAPGAQSREANVCHDAGFVIGM